jgi:uncharacterized membrane-anchored protein
MNQPASSPAVARPDLKTMLCKVPELTLFFWIIKILATTIGETAADYINTNLNLGLVGTSAVMIGLLIVALIVQFRARRYVPVIYWVAIVLISVVGTLITDNMVNNFGISLPASTAIFSVALVATFIGWYSSERTLSIHSIYTTRREAWYWLTVLFTFALGTATGDLIAETYALGYWPSALLFAGIIAFVTLLYRFAKLNAIVTFWIAYVLTRPLGASIGDFLSQDREVGGLALGTTTTSLIFLVAIAAVIVYLTLTKRDEVTVAEAAQ